MRMEEEENGGQYRNRPTEDMFGPGLGVPFLFDLINI
jgi:hypothetical protein